MTNISFIENGNYHKDKAAASQRDIILFHRYQLGRLPSGRRRGNPGEEKTDKRIGKATEKGNLVSGGLYMGGRMAAVCFQAGF